jgi:phosphoglycerate dehydrogenase-like enzyme
VDDTDQPAVERALRDADVLLHVLTPVTGAMLRGAPRLKLMQKIGVGTNTMDLEAAAALDIAVCNMPGTNSRAVSEHTLALMLAVLRRLGTLDAACRQGRGWKLEPDLFDSIGEIGGRTVGFVGYGAIPRCLTPALLALGAHVVYVRRAAEPENETANDPRRLPSLAALLAQSDVVSLHLPLTGETRGILDARALQAMKPGAILINTARGGLVDEVALIAALRSGHLAAAGLDVFAAEPTAADNPLFALPNVVLTPHVAWLTPETLDRSIGVIMENCRRLRDGEPLLHRVV